jgi:DNA-binding transcriptional MerR regulator
MVYHPAMNEPRPARTLPPSELARLSGLSKDTLWHYERRGLLSSARLANGYRAYPEWAPGRVRLVQRALSFGFTLDELARLLTIRRQGGAPCRRARDLAAAKLEAIDRQLRELKSLKQDLRAVPEDWDRRLAKTRRGKRAWLLESFAEPRPATAGRSHASSPGAARRENRK